MKTENQIREFLNKTMEDERLSYPTAEIDVNAPLALIQLTLETTCAVLKWVLDEKSTKEASNG